MKPAMSGDERTRTPAPTPLGVDIQLHHLQRGDVFAFVEVQVDIDRGKKIHLPAGNLKVTIPPWGPKSPMVGPVGPWMFACRDDRGIEHHFALPPRMEVRRIYHGPRI